MITTDLCQLHYQILSITGVYDKECKKYMEIKKDRLNWEFNGFKNGRLNYKYKECKKSYTKLANESIKNLQLCINFAMVI